jgi:hypothetical protein
VHGLLDEEEAADALAEFVAEVRTKGQVQARTTTT